MGHNCIQKTHLNLTVVVKKNNMYSQKEKQHTLTHTLVSVMKGKVSYRKQHPPFTKGAKRLLDGELWRVEHRSGVYVDVTWTTD